MEFLNALYLLACIFTCRVFLAVWFVCSIFLGYIIVYQLCNLFPVFY